MLCETQHACIGSTGLRYSCSYSSQGVLAHVLQTSPLTSSSPLSSQICRLLLARALNNLQGGPAKDCSFWRGALSALRALAPGTRRGKYLCLLLLLKTKHCRSMALLRWILLELLVWKCVVNFKTVETKNLILLPLFIFNEKASTSKY